METHRLKLEISYDGAAFHGWQRQPERQSVQETIEDAFSAICGSKIAVAGAGRTDAGVHALEQIAQADVRQQRENDEWRDALNGNLPPEARVMGVHEETSDWHARFSARGKLYRYRIWNSKVMHPLELGRTWHVPAALDMDRMQSGAAELAGRRDLASFAANRGREEERTVREIYSLAVHRENELVTLDVEADGFLYRMARMLTGMLVRIGQNPEGLSELQQLLEEPRLGRCRFCAPAHGLYLVKVFY